MCGIPFHATISSPPPPTWNGFDDFLNKNINAICNLSSAITKTSQNANYLYKYDIKEWNSQLILHYDKITSNYCTFWQGFVRKRAEK